MFLNLVLLFLCLYALCWFVFSFCGMLTSVKTAHHIHVHFPLLLKCSYCSFNFCPPFQHFSLFSLFLPGVVFTVHLPFASFKILASFLSSLLRLQVPIKSKCKRNLETHWCHALFLVDFIREELEYHCEVSCCLATSFSPVRVCDAGLTNASAFNGKDGVQKTGQPGFL